MTDYVAQSTHNKKTHDFLNTKTPEYRDWEITTLFYAALHAVNRHLESKGIKMPKNHVVRLRLVKIELPSIFEEYKNLKLLSERSRYLGQEKVSGSSLKSALESYFEIMRKLA